MYSNTSLRFLVLIFGIILSSCSSSDDDITPSSNQDNLSIQLINDLDIENFDTDMTLFNGAFVSYIVIDQRGLSTDPDLIEIKNISNNNVTISVANSKLRFKTNQSQDQNFSFDIFYNGNLLKSISSTLKVLYKLTKNGQDVEEGLLLDFTQPNTTKEFKIVNIDGSEIANFDSRYVSFVDEKNLVLGGYQTFNGQNFKFLFRPTEGTKTEFKAILNYRQESTNFNDVYVAEMTIKIPNKAESNCKIITEKFTVTNSVGDAINKNFELLIKDDLFVEFKNTFDRNRSSLVFYSGDKIVEVYDQSRGYAQIEYLYENNRLKKSIERSSAQDLDITYDFYYDNSDHLIAKTYRNYNSGNTLFEKDSIVYSNYVNRYPTKRIQFNFDSENTLQRTLYFKSQFDTKGNITKEEISTNNIDFVVRYEATYDLNQTVIQYFVKETGETFKENSLLLSQTSFVDIETKPITPIQTLLKDINKDAQGNIIFFEHTFSDPTENENIRLINEYSFSTSECPKYF